MNFYKLFFSFNINFINIIKFKHFHYAYDYMNFVKNAF